MSCLDIPIQAALFFVIGQSHIGGGTPDDTVVGGRPGYGITLAGRPDVIYVRLREVADALALTIHLETDPRAILLGGVALTMDRLMEMPNGMTIIPIRDLAAAGVRIEWDEKRGQAELSVSDRSVVILRRSKRVVIDRTTRMIRAWQGKRLVLESQFSTGPAGNRTPVGSYRAGPTKEPLLRSGRYHFAPMPWSVQVEGSTFVHGFQEARGEQVSDGCIRLPMGGVNAAKWFYDWIDIGTPVDIIGRLRG